MLDHPIDTVVRGSRGYAEQAEELVLRYEGIDFAAKHGAVLPLLPAAPASAIDIGAGTGRDAAWLAERGYRVVAVEPTEAMRSRAIALHPTPAIEWIDDSLPALHRVVAQRRRFDLVMLTAVWMHLDAEERRIAMANVAALLAPFGLLVITLRHGPVPIGRVMFAVSAEETIALAEAHGLRLALDVHAESSQAANRDAGVSWTQLAFRPKPDFRVLAADSDGGGKSREGPSDGVIALRSPSPPWQRRFASA